MVCHGFWSEQHKSTLLLTKKVQFRADYFVMHACENQQLPKKRHVKRWALDFNLFPRVFCFNPGIEVKETKISFSIGVYRSHWTVWEPSFFIAHNNYYSMSPAEQGRSQGGPGVPVTTPFASLFQPNNLQQVAKMPWRYLGHSDKLVSTLTLKNAGYAPAELSTRFLITSQWFL